MNSVVRERESISKALVGRGRDYYVNSDLINLQVKNPHFNMVHAYNRLLLVEGDREIFGKQFFYDFYTAIVEDTLRCGPVEFEFFGNSNWDGLKLTHSSYKEGSDISRTTLNGAKLRRDQNLPWERQYWELRATRWLRSEWKSCPEGSVYVWLYPADESGLSGYKPISLAYFYEVEGKPGRGRRIKGEFYQNPLSLEGNRRVLERLSRQKIDREEFGVARLLGTPVNISDCPLAQTAEDVFRIVDETAEEDWECVVEAVANEDGGLSLETFSAYRGQIKESVEFLTEVIIGIYDLVGENLDQKLVDELEIAYSFARRVVEAYDRKKGLVLAEQLMSDFKKKLNMDQRLKQAVQDPVRWAVLYRKAMIHEEQMKQRYGDLSAAPVGGSGCPGGMMRGLGFGGLGGPTLSSFGQIEQGNELVKEGGFNCPECKRYIPTGSGDKCPHCGYTKEQHARKTGVRCG